MEHFADEAWVDLIRGINPPQRKDMESHLANGCLLCKASHHAWAQVHTVAVQEGRFTPPENLVRMAKLIFEQNLLASQEDISARLTFDTFASPALAGVRSTGAASARQMVYEADGLTVDLRFDISPLSKVLNLTGQVLDKRIPRSSLEYSEVIVWTQKGLPLAQTKANAFGEFNLEFEPQNNLRLAIRIIGRAHIHIQLVNFCAEPKPDTDPDKSDISN